MLCFHEQNCSILIYLMRGIWLYVMTPFVVQNDLAYGQSYMDSKAQFN